MSDGEFSEDNEPSGSGGEFDERIEPFKSDVRWTRLSRWHDALSKKRSMRMLVGLPVVYTALFLYVGLGCSVVFHWTTMADVKDLATILSVPGTLAATVIGFFFGGRSAKKR